MGNPKLVGGGSSTSVSEFCPSIGWASIELQASVGGGTVAGVMDTVALDALAVVMFDGEGCVCTCTLTLTVGGINE